MTKERLWLSAVEANDLWPDTQHFDSTLENLEWMYRASEALRCWQLDRVDPFEVDPSIQLHDDPDDVEGIEKIAAIRAVIVAGERLPPVWLVHHPQDEYSWLLLEGRHRYNAAHAEHTGLLAWVAHVGCCGGPDADLPG